MNHSSMDQDGKSTGANITPVRSICDRDATPMTISLNNKTSQVPDESFPITKNNSFDNLDQSLLNGERSNQIHQEFDQSQQGADMPGSSQLTKKSNKSSLLIYSDQAHAVIDSEIALSGIREVDSKA